MHVNVTVAMAVMRSMVNASQTVAAHAMPGVLETRLKYVGEHLPCQFTVQVTISHNEISIFLPTL